MAFLLMFIAAVFLHRNGIYAVPCNNPEVTRKQVFIYRIAEEIKVEVFHCQFLYNTRPSLAYSDITKHCKIAAGVGLLKDKWGKIIKVGSEGLIVERYITKADLIGNEMKLRSGTVCRYDRGFCFDPKEDVNYAVTWDVIHKSPESCPKMAVEQVFYGYLDVWNFPEKSLRYLFYYKDHYDEAFYLKLTKSVDCKNKPIWYTERNGFIVTEWKMDTNMKPSSYFYFPIKSKRIVSEALMRNCDLHGYMQNLERGHVMDPETADNLVKLYEKMKMEARTEIEQIIFNKFRNLTIDIRSS